MSRTPKLHVQLTKDGEHVRISRGNLYTFTVKKSEVVDLCNRLVDLIEEDT